MRFVPRLRVDFVPTLWAGEFFYLAYGWISYPPYGPKSFVPSLWMDFVPALSAGEFCTSLMDGFRR